MAGRKAPVQGPGYHPHIIVHGGRGEALGVWFTDAILFELGKCHYAEILGPYDLVDYSEVVKDARFTVVEGSKVVGEGRVIAVSVMDNESKTIPSEKEQ
jgi:hypothetical protein